MWVARRVLEPSPRVLGTLLRPGLQEGGGTAGVPRTLLSTSQHFEIRALAAGLGCRTRSFWWNSCCPGELGTAAADRMPATLGTSSESARKTQTRGSEPPCGSGVTLGSNRPPGLSSVCTGATAGLSRQDSPSIGREPWSADSPVSARLSIHTLVPAGVAVGKPQSAFCGGPGGGAHRCEATGGCVHNRVLSGHSPLRDNRIPEHCGALDL